MRANDQQQAIYITFLKSSVPFSVNDSMGFRNDSRKTSPNGYNKD